MTSQEALQNIKKQREEAGIAFLGNIYLTVEEYCKVVDALEKQIPKKPIKKNLICYRRTVDGRESYAYDCYCPTCDTNVNNEKHHCPCGQALDWSDTE